MIAAQKLTRPPTWQIGLVSLTVALTIAGFQLISFFATGPFSRQVTIPFRAATAVLTLLVGAVGLLRGFRARNDALALGVFFWFVYGARLLLDVVLLGRPFPLPPLELIEFAFGICLLGFLSFAVISDLRLYGWALPCTTIGLFLASIFSLRYILENREKLAFSGPRVQGNEVLNHITLGHTGAALALVALFLLVRPGRRHPWLAIVLALVGLAVLALSLSRGAVAAFAACGLLALYCGWRWGARRVVAVALLATCLLVTVIVGRAMALGFRIDQAFSVLELERGTSTEGRFLLQAKALNLFGDHPVFGGAAAVPGLGDHGALYPHNIIIEALMATGILGTVPLLLFLALIVRKCLRILREKPEFGWLVLLVLQFLLGAMFSGGIYNSTLLWPVLGMMVGLDLQKRATSHLRQAPSEFNLRSV